MCRDFAKLPLQLFLHQICVFFNESVPIVHYNLFLLSLYHCLFLCTSYPACMLSTNSSHMALRAFLYSLIYSLTFLDLAEVFLSMTLTGLQYMYIERVLGGCNPSFTPFWPLSTVVLHRMSLMWEMGNKSRSPHFLFYNKILFSVANPPSWISRETVSREFHYEKTNFGRKANSDSWSLVLALVELWNTFIHGARFCSPSFTLEPC